MTKNTKVNAAILIIGNEILSGRTKDTNTSAIALWLNSIGVKVNEVRVIPDIEDTIIDTVNHLRKIYDYVFTTGGIGPTHDDITAQSISKAFKLKYKIHKEAFKILTVSIIVSSISGITLTSLTLTPIEFNQRAIVPVFVSCVLPERISLPIINIEAFTFVFFVIFDYTI